MIYYIYMGEVRGILVDMIINTDRLNYMHYMVTNMYNNLYNIHT
jgi:hypothetical protein